jgi:hypothetical protein
MTDRDRRRETGAVLLFAVIMLVLLSAIGIAAMDRSSADLQQSGSSRRTARTFHAADGGIQIAASRLMEVPPITDAFSVNLEDGTTVRSGPRTAASAQPITMVGSGPPPDGDCINVGTSCFRTDLYQATATALEAGNSSVEIDAGFSIVVPGTGGYE